MTNTRLSRSQGVALVTLTLEVLAEHHGWHIEELGHDGVINPNGYLSKLLDWGRESVDSLEGVRAMGLMLANAKHEHWEGSGSVCQHPDCLAD